MRQLSALLVLMLSLSVTSPASASSKVEAAAVYSKAAGGYWVLARVMLVGCEKSATISQSGSFFVVAIQKRPGPVCPQIAREADYSLFVEAGANPKTVKIDTGAGTAFPCSVGTSEPEK